MKYALRRFVWLSIVVAISAAVGFQARAQGLPNVCPAPAQWVSVSGAFMCQCPNGAYLSLGQTCGAAPGLNQFQNSSQAEFAEYSRYWNACFGPASDAQLEMVIAECNQALSYNRATIDDRNRLISRRAELQGWRGEAVTFRSSWSLCFASPQTEAEALTAIGYCNLALGYSRLVPVDRNNLNNQRATLQAKMTQLQQKAAEQQAHGLFLEQKQACGNGNIDACTKALTSLYADDESDGNFLRSELTGLQSHAEARRKCREGSAITCDSLLWYWGLSQSERTELERWRAASPPWSKAWAFTVLLWYTFAPSSTIIASGVAAVLALTLLAVMIRQRIRNKRERPEHVQPHPASKVERPPSPTSPDRAIVLAEPTDHVAASDLKPVAAPVVYSMPIVAAAPDTPVVEPKIAAVPLQARRAVSTALDKQTIKQAFRQRRVQFEL